MSTIGMRFRKRSIPPLHRCTTFRIILVVSLDGVFDGVKGGAKRRIAFGCLAKGEKRRERGSVGVGFCG